MAQVTRVSRFVLWICRHFTKSQIQQIVKELDDILANLIDLAIFCPVFLSLSR